MNNRRLYVFEFWRNDGEWHDLGYDRSPTLIFEAKDDGEARELVYGYIRLNSTHERADVSLHSLYEVDIKIKKRKLRFKKIWKSSSQSFEKPSRRVEERVNATTFKGLENYMEEQLK